MINFKYYQDIKNFADQFQYAIEIANTINLSEFANSKYSRVILAGMGGSALAGDVVNNIISATKIFVHSDYDLPTDYNPANDLLIVASYSGNTEEAISSLNAALKQNVKPIVFSAGGMLTNLASENGLVLFKLPAGIQPRLSTGYFFTYLLYILDKLNFAKVNMLEVEKAFKNAKLNLREEYAIEIAQKLHNKTVIIYSDRVMWGIAKVAKIKFNENSKVQSFWNYYPELNHNEMVGFTMLTSNPIFIQLRTKFGHPKNANRMSIFNELMKQKNCEVINVYLEGENLIEEIFYAYYFADLVSYYLAESYEIDPEPVEMVEEFKKILSNLEAESV